MEGGSRPPPPPLHPWASPGPFRGSSKTEQKRPGGVEVLKIPNSFRATILDMTLETNPTQIGKLMHIHTTNFVTPSSPVQCCKPWRNNIRYFAILSGGSGGLKGARLFYKEFITRGMRNCYTGKGSLNEVCPRL